MSTVPLRDDDEQISLIEQDLINHCVNALKSNQISAAVHGVFSLDDLETKMDTDLNGLIGVGVGYQGGKATAVGANASADPQVTIMNEMLFLIVLSVPSDALTTQRFYATKLLTILRKGIIGKSVALTARTQRPWTFVQEKPEIAQSTKSMLYYSQVWRLLMPVIGN